MGWNSITKNSTSSVEKKYGQAPQCTTYVTAKRSYRKINQTLQQRVRCMRIDVGLSKQFWAEAFNITAYLINRSPSTVVDFKTPQDVWSS